MITWILKHFQVYLNTMNYSTLLHTTRAIRSTDFYYLRKNLWRFFFHFAKYCHYFGSMRANFYVRLYRRYTARLFQISQWCLHSKVVPGRRFKSSLSFAAETWDSLHTAAGRRQFITFRLSSHTPHRFSLPPLRLTLFTLILHPPFAQVIHAKPTSCRSRKVTKYIRCNTYPSQ